MTGAAQKPVFTAERMRSKRLHGGKAEAAAAGAAVVADDGQAGRRHDEIMAAIEGLRKEMSTFHEIKGTLTEDYKREILEAEHLKRELESLAEAINETKREIAALRLNHAAGDRLSVVTDELDAVTAATEDATEGILAAAESIDDRVSTLRIHVDPDHQGHVDDIADLVVKIFESCNFQDVTGQRITKVVNTLRFVEDRVETMMEILGGQKAFEEVEHNIERDEEEEKRLLNGPQMEAKKIGQDEIDALFD